MKKICLFVLIFVFHAMTWAQNPILSEGFEGQQFPPSGWSRESILMSMYTWFRGGPLNTYDWWGNQYHVVPPEGVRMAALECDLSEEWGPQDESLITPMIALEHPAVLTFETFCQYGLSQYQDHYKVDVLDASGSWITLWDGAEQPTAWLNQFEEPVSIGLSAFQGQNIKLRFRGHNNGNDVLTYSWFIDNVKVLATDTIPDSVDEIALRVDVYPNPVNQFLTIRSAQVLQHADFYNVLGVKVKEIAIDDQEAVVDVSQLPPGVYVVEVFCANHQKIFKTIVANP